MSCLIKHHATKTYGGLEVQCQALTSALNTPAALPWGKGPRYPLDKKMGGVQKFTLLKVTYISGAKVPTSEIRTAETSVLLFAGN
jgi:hypothetical protein